jgi:hypothetical protein
MLAAARQILPIEVEAVFPTVTSVLEAQGIPADVTPNWRTLEVAEKAAEVFQQVAKPIGIWASISLAAFERVFGGEGHNASATPIEDTARRADDLALFAVTVGNALPLAIADLFDQQEPALASMLDAHASEGAELAADYLERRYVDWLSGNGRMGMESGALRYSPGYCGWHVSGQRSLFEYLLPEEVGITLRESFLMQPLKSISGVIIAGRKEIFDFENTFDFCEECSTWTCRERISAVLREEHDGST